jgi:uncharacterized protein
VIVPDVNLLVYAYDADSSEHRRAKSWWEAVLSSRHTVGIPWTVILGFIRIMTHRSVLLQPVSPAEALADVRAWLGRENVRVVEPGPRHLDILEELLGALGVAGSLTTDAHLAALAIEYQAELHSNDVDFARFTGLRWKNPLTALE